MREPMCEPTLAGPQGSVEVVAEHPANGAMRRPLASALSL